MAYRVRFLAASQPVAGWCRGPSWAACTTSTRGPLELEWSFPTLQVLGIPAPNASEAMHLPHLVSTVAFP